MLLRTCHRAETIDDCVKDMSPSGQFTGLASSRQIHVESRKDLELRAKPIFTVEAGHLKIAACQLVTNPMLHNVACPYILCRASSSFCSRNGLHHASSHSNSWSSFTRRLPAPMSRIACHTVRRDRLRTKYSSARRMNVVVHDFSQRFHIPLAKGAGRNPGHASHVSRSDGVFTVGSYILPVCMSSPYLSIVHLKFQSSFRC